MDEVSMKELERLLKEKRKAEKGGRFSKFIVTFVIMLNVLFTTAVFYVFLQTGGNEPTSLIAAWFGFTTVELWALAGIKKKEVEKSSNQEEI